VICFEVKRESFISFFSVKAKQKSYAAEVGDAAAITSRCTTAKAARRGALSRAPIPVLGVSW
jgi:hypothetical protein